MAGQVTGVIVPLVLERKNPMVARAIRLACKTQVAADRQIVKYLPSYVGTYDPDSKRIQRERVQDKPATQSQYTLSSGTSAFKASRKRRPKAEIGADGWTLRAIVHDVPECGGPPTAVLRPKSYLNRDRPAARVVHVPRLQGDEMWLTRPIG